MSNTSDLRPVLQERSYRGRVARFNAVMMYDLLIGRSDSNARVF
jgi:hypothetical protein